MLAAKMDFPEIKVPVSAGLSVALDHTKSITATNANAALIIRTFNECVSPIS
jgi:hypothetical protein